MKKIKDDVNCKNQQSDNESELDERYVLKYDDNGTPYLRHYDKEFKAHVNIYCSAPDNRGEERVKEALKKYICNNLIFIKLNIKRKTGVF